MDVCRQIFREEKKVMKNRNSGNWFFVMLFAGALSFVGATAMAGLDEAAVGKCKTCHEETVTKFLGGAHHGKAFAKGDPATKYSCESCHGNADKHVTENTKESIITFGKKALTPAKEQAAQCLSCHGKSKMLTFWQASKHKSNDVACASCHSAHNAGGTKVATETCLDCHKDIKHEISKKSHHPIKEGKVSCSDCHNPHGSLGHGEINADTNNQLCYKCHGDKRGPFLWEHAPVEENCMLCHTPHGAMADKLLKSRMPYLCQECHQTGSHPSTAFTVAQGWSGSKGKTYVGRSCNNCHSRIHGSNAPHNAATGEGYNGGKYFVR